MPIPLLPVLYGAFYVLLVAALLIAFHLAALAEPNDRNATSALTAINARILPYSMAVAARELRLSRLMSFNMSRHPGQRWMFPFLALCR